ncbi:MFS transporter [Propionispora vibrioides]|uniref:Predicted arabinose efflux permease, MFS family n=1 Tax=Propionispora vibrioides TaxID=112903 RepID=A0A1H8XMH7_9FIRM|nr:MFS transporter [Propionispora vibrioides]SEP40963.1 Predicted arabinose efflux permease, MFS family [Propionispora vibrioides]
MVKQTDAQSEPQEQTKIWNFMFISIFFANMVMNLAQYMSNALLAIYADSLGASASAIGVLMSTFAVSALLFKVVSAPAMDTYNRKYLVAGAMVTMTAAFLGYSLSQSVPSLIAFRILQGCGQAFGNVCCLAMVAETLPKSKYGAGIGYYSLAQVVAQASGPTVGLWLVSQIGYHLTFAFNAGVMLLAAFLAFKIKIRYKRTKKLKITLNNILAKEAFLPATVLVFIIMAFCVVNSFLVVFANEQGVGSDISLYFTVSAITMIFTRPIVGKLTDRFGFVRVFTPALFCDVISFFIISVSHTLSSFLLAAFLASFGFGACQPAIQALAMKCVPNERRGAGSSTNFVGMDIGNLLGPTFAGLVAQTFGYRIMWRVMVVPLLIAIVVVIIFKRKIACIEASFLATQRSH